MPRRQPTIRAIPTKYKGVLFRSRLESQWARMLDTLEWGWTYEPDLQVGRVIPDFLLSFPAHPVVLECKPAVTQAEITLRRRELIRKMPEWLTDDVLRELRVLRADEFADPGEIARATADLVSIESGGNPTGHSRRVLVVGPVLFDRPDRVRVDDDYAFCLCSGERSHVGLSREIGDRCLYCGSACTSWLPPNLVIGAWREAGAAQQWRPARGRRSR